jgi:hypothetical protein
VPVSKSTNKSNPPRLRENLVKRLSSSNPDLS